MKELRDGWRPLQREEVREELRQDSYKSTQKLRALARCPDCGAVYKDARWQWAAVDGDVHEESCPACHRMRDHFPAGYVTLSGPFVREHRESLLNLVHNREAQEKAEHALQRIMTIEDQDGGVLVTTTDAHLARIIGEAVHAAYKGEIEYRYNKKENMLHVLWSR